MEVYSDRFNFWYEHLKKNMFNGIIIDFKTQIVSNITYNTSAISVSVIPNCTVNINIYFCVRSGAIYKPDKIFEANFDFCVNQHTTEKFSFHFQGGLR